MGSNAKRIAAERRALAAGLSASIATHVIALTLLSVPGGGSGEAGSEAPRVIDDSFDAIEVVELAEPAPAATESAVAVTASQAAYEPSAPVATPSIESLLGQLTPAVTEVTLPESSSPVVTFRDLEPIAPDASVMAALAYGGGALEGEEEDGGGIGGFLGRLGAALSGGGHCPTPGGPLILR